MRLEEIELSHINDFDLETRQFLLFVRVTTRIRDKLTCGNNIVSTISDSDVLEKGPHDSPQSSGFPKINNLSLFQVSIIKFENSEG